MTSGSTSTRQSVGSATVTGLGKAGVRLLAVLTALTVLSQFFRVSNGVIAPELIRDLGLTPSTLGLANGAFFLALLVMQIPVGMLFDRIGPRRTVVWLIGIAVAGSLFHAAVTSAGMLVAARLAIGTGCAASFMAGVVLCSRWFAADRLALTLSWVFALSNLGTVLGSTPLAWASETIGWRATFVGMAGITAAVGFLFWFVARDEPPGRTTDARETESLRAILRGVGEVWRRPGLGRVLAMHCFAYASMVTVLGLWAGPYLYDVYGMDAVARGNVLLWMGVAQIAGIFCVGPLDRLFNTRKGIVVGGALSTIAVLVALAAIPRPPAGMAAALLILLCFVTSYGIVIVAHGRSLFPDRLAGRGVTTVNLAQISGCAFLPIATGLIVDMFPASEGAVPEVAYRVVFAFIAVMLGLGLLAYLGARDSKPRPPFATGPVATQ